MVMGGCYFAETEELQQQCTAAIAQNSGTDVSALTDGPYRIFAENTRQPVSVNPLSWSTDTARVPKEKNLGTLADGKLHPGVLGAKVTGGVCQVDFADTKGAREKYLPAELRPQAAGKDFHEADWSLWWGNVRANAEQRIAAWLAANPSV